MTIEIVSFPIKDGGFPMFPIGMLVYQRVGHGDTIQNIYGRSNGIVKLYQFQSVSELLIPLNTYIMHLHSTTLL